MSDIKELVRDNLVRLRKEHKLTQLELSQKINYSDKAISRWETGEVTPDVETLAALASLYEVPIGVFFLPPDAKPSKEERRIQKEWDKQIDTQGPVSSCEHSLPRRVAYLIFNLCFLWASVICLFFILNGFAVPNAWRALIWGVPVSALLLMIFLWQPGGRTVRIVFGSIFSWTLLGAIYLQLLAWHLFPIFFLGIPLQAMIILLPFLRKQKKAPAENENE